MRRLTTETHPLITTEVLEELHKHKIYNEDDFLQVKVSKLQDITKIRFKDICKLFTTFLSRIPILNGLSVYNEVKRRRLCISSGIDSVDSILEGGFKNFITYELCGYPGNGKTLFCFNVIRQYLNDFNNYVYYIDTKRDFVITKFRNMLLLDGLSEEVINERLKRVLVYQCNTKFDLVNTLYVIINKLNLNLIQTHLIIIDSLAAVAYNTINYERDIDLLDGICNAMRILSGSRFVTVIATNFITTKMQNDESADSMHGEMHSVKFEPTQLRIDKVDKENFKLCIMSSGVSDHEQLSCSFQL